MIVCCDVFLCILVDWFLVLMGFLWIGLCRECICVRVLVYSMVYDCCGCCYFLVLLLGCIDM